jgi:putative chitinase
MITSEQLQKIGIEAQWTDALNHTFEKFEINTKDRMASFIGQCMHESGNFKHLEENLNYSAVRLTQIFPNRFTLAKATDCVAKGKPAIAEAMYGKRADLGNTQDGDGGKFFGRGLIQLTGRANYTAFATAIAKPEIIENPSLLATPEYACLSAGWFWNTRKLNTCADTADYTTMTKRINGGTLGLAERENNIKKILTILGSS